jgi:hypothetical protein
MYDVEFDVGLRRWCLHYASEMICLQATTEAEARAEAEAIVENWE